MTDRIILNKIKRILDIYSYIKPGILKQIISTTRMKLLHGAILLLIYWKTFLFCQDKTSIFEWQKSY